MTDHKGKKNAMPYLLPAHPGAARHFLKKRATSEIIMLTIIIVVMGK